MKTKLVVAAAGLMALVGAGHIWCAVDPEAWIKDQVADQPGLMGLLGEDGTLGALGVDGLLVLMGVAFLLVAGATLLVLPRIAARLPARAGRVIRPAGWIGGIAWCLALVVCLPAVAKAASQHPTDGMVWGAAAGLAFCPVWFAALWQTRGTKPTAA
ncbi:MAG: hypothetical protein LBR19_03880 [Bifidobacteriaceae bacterium]|jgi:Na+/proline symporter|nr:hypothetical protein [Bifidobacteriaceae bacterium]